MRQKLTVGYDDCEFAAKRKLFIGFTEFASLTANLGGVLKKQSSGVMYAGLLK